jgi:hypothetical protein
MRCHLGVSYPYCQRKAPLQPLDALHIMYTNKQLHEEASRSLYASMTVNLQSFWGLRAFKTAIRPMKWSSLTWIELDADFLAVDFSKYSDAWTMLCGIENLSSLSIRVDSDALDIAAVQDAHLRTRFARQLSLPGPREEEDTIDRAKKQLDCLFQIARCLMGQIAETAARCQRIKALSIGRFVGYRAIGRSVSIGLDALQSMDYDEIEASIMPRIERELEEAGCFE